MNSIWANIQMEREENSINKISSLPPFFTFAPKIPKNTKPNWMTQIDKDLATEI